MITKTALKIRGFRGRGVPNSFYLHEEGSDALCILFGGWHYTTEMPLFYYSCRVLAGAGFDVLAVDFRYSTDPRYARLSDRKRQEIFLSEVRAAFAAPERSRYRRLMVGAKSLGTMALAHLSLEGLLGDEARLVWLSPLLEAESIRGTLAACTNPSLVVVGNRDARYSEPLLKELGRNAALDIMIVERANEDLEIEGDAVRSIELLAGYVSRLRGFASASRRRRSRATANAEGA